MPQQVDNGNGGSPPGRGELAPVQMGEHWTRDEQPNHDGHTAGGGNRPPPSPLMTNHGGKVMTTFAAQAIFWGTSWNAYSGDKMTGIDSFYGGFSGSNYAKTSVEYGGTNGQVGATGTALAHVVDASTASSSTTAILGEVCKLAKAGTITLDPNGNSYVPVYTDVKRGHATFCAWHSYGTCTVGTQTIPVQFGFFFNLDGDAGCDPQDTSGLHSQGLAAIANVSAHELSEAMTDPATPGAWYDSGGNENGDKCAWTFGTDPVTGSHLATFSDGTQWKVQGEWSNAAFTANTGYANRSGQNGCLGGL
jgi:hypothetical protein